MRSRRSAPPPDYSRGIGEILVSEGVIAGKQLEEAFRLGKRQQQELGLTLFFLGYVDQKDLAKALTRRLRLEFTELSASDVYPEASGLVDRRVLRR